MIDERGSAAPAARRVRRPAHRRAPRPLAAAIDRFAERLQPRTLLARIQRIWPQLASVLPATAECTPTAVREGVLTVTCTASVYAQEVQLVGEELVAAVNGAVGEEAVSALRVRTR